MNLTRPEVVSGVSKLVPIWGFDRVKLTFQLQSWTDLFISIPV